MLQRPVTTVAKRGLAAAAAQPAAREQQNQSRQAEAKTSRLSNGLTVTSVDRHGPLSRLAIAFRAGSRYERENQRGASHRLRNCVGHSSQNHLSYELIWRSGILGANVGAYTTRDLFVVTMDAWRDYTVPALEVLGELACRPAFRAWELHDSKESMLIERELMKEHKGIRCLELLHKAAFRNSALANSTLAPKYAIGKLTSAVMEEYAREHLLSGEATLVGINVDHSQMLSYAEQCPVVSGKGQATPQGVYVGGQEDKHTGGPLAHMMIAGKAGGLADAKSSATAAVYCALLSAGPPVKYSATSGQGVASKAVASVLGNNAFGVTSIYTMYADQGLAGLYIVCEGGNADKAAHAAMKSMQDVGAKGPSADDLKRAKAIALSHALQRAEQDASLLEDAVTQALAGAEIISDADAVFKLVDSVTQQDVAALAKQVAANPSMASVGNVANVPLLTQMK